MTRALKVLLAELEARPIDVSLLSRVAELQRKLGRNEEAAETFLRLAPAFEDDGVAIKAAAVLKLAVRLAPANVAARAELANIYGMLGLTSDAIGGFRELLRVSRLNGDQASARQALEGLLCLGASEESN